MDEQYAPGLPTRDQLLDYVEKIRPLAGERAERALELATSGKVHKLVPGLDGRDRWEVERSGEGCGAYSVSIQGRYCSCPDAANGAPRWMDAPLCKHRLAVMYIQRWQEDEANHQSHTPARPSCPAEYVTIAPPSRSNQGWRWKTVRHQGALVRYSQEEFPNQDTAMRVARVVADCKNLPLYLNGFAHSE